MSTTTPTEIRNALKERITEVDEASGLADGPAAIPIEHRIKRLEQQLFFTLGALSATLKLLGATDE